MAKQRIKIYDIPININQDGYVSITDIAKQSSENKPAFTIQNWMRNQNTLSFLMTWERVHNQNFKVGQIPYFIHNPDFKYIGSDVFKGFEAI